MKQEAQCKQFLCTKPTYWNSSESWNTAAESYYIRQGNIVMFYIKTSRITPNTQTLFYTLPSGYRPTTEELFIVPDASGSHPEGGNINVKTDGRVMVTNPSQYMWGNIVFYTADAFPTADLA